VVIHYDPHDLMSVSFSGGGTDAAIAATSRWMGGHFPKMAAANFVGAAGQEAVRGSVLNELQRLAATLETQPFMTSEDIGS